MDKRMWIGMAVALVLLLALSACDRGDLAGDLTPVPTLPPGEEPALVDAIQTGSQQAEQGGQSQQGDQGAGGDQAQLVARGETLFQDNCSGCHGATDGAGPAFTGMAERAANRVEGQSAEDYIHESIVEPTAFVVPGFQPIMPSFASLPDEDVQALVAYIMSESGGGSAAAGEGEAQGEATPAATEAAAEPSGGETPQAEATPAATEAAAGQSGGEQGAAAPAQGDPAAGQVVFEANCSGCHQQTDGAGPAVKGMGERAATRVEGMTAAEYLHESIVDPHAYVVEGFNDIMPDNFDETLSEADINNLVAFLLTQ